LPKRLSKRKIKNRFGGLRFKTVLKRIKLSKEDDKMKTEKETLKILDWAKAQKGYFQSDEDKAYQRGYICALEFALGIPSKNDYILKLKQDREQEEFKKQEDLKIKRENEKSN